MPVEALKGWQPAVRPSKALIPYEEVKASLEGQDLEDALQIWLVDLESPLLQQALLAVTKTQQEISRDRRAQRNWAHRLAKDMFGQAD